MAEDADAGRRQPSARRRVRLPVVAIEGREDMGVMLARYGRLLRERARSYLPEGTSDDAVEDAVERTVDRLLDIEQPRFSHGLGYACQVLWDECRRGERPQPQPGVLVDRRLGVLTPRKLRVMEHLSPRARQTIMRAAQGWTTAQIAEADNTTPGAVRFRLFHARRRVLQLLGESGPPAPAFLLAWLDRRRASQHRIAAWAQRNAAALTWRADETLTSFLVVTVAALAGGGTPVLPGVAAASSRPPQLREMIPGRTAERPMPQGTVAQGDEARLNSTATPERRPAAVSPSLSGDLLILGGRLPGEETPEDTQFETAVAAPHYGVRAHAIVALGLGHACACKVLFQSTDGGARWAPSPVQAPPGAEQLALPPEYPDDPRIFVGTNAQSGGSAYVVPQFGGAAVPLPGPPGHLALAAGFDHGDERVFIAGREAVVSLAVDSAAPQLTPLLVYPQWPGIPASVATPGTSDGPAVLVLAPPGTVAVGDPAELETAQTAVFECSVGATCVERGAPPPLAEVLSTAPSGMVAAAWSAHGVSTSTDLGRSFRPVSADGGLAGFIPLSVAASDGRVWAVLQHGTVAALVWSGTAGGSWSDVTRFDPALIRSTRVVAVPGGPVLDLLGGGGLRCTSDGGIRWGSRCP